MHNHQLIKFTDRTGFHTAIQDLAEYYGAETVPLYYEDPRSGDHIELPHHLANINPAWIAGDDTAVWSPVSSSYIPVDAVDMYEPLLRVMEERDLEPHGRFYSASTPLGAQVVGFIWFPSLETEVGDSTFEPGIMTGYSHDRSTPMFAEPAAMVSGSTRMTGLGERHTRRHVAPIDAGNDEAVAEVAAWWDTEIGRLSHVGSALTTAVADAKAYQIDIPSAFNTTDVLATDLPTTLAKDAVAHGGLPDDPNDVTAWDLAISLYRALGQYDVTIDGAAYRSHMRTANDWLFRPPRAEHQAIEQLREDERAKTETLDGRQLRHIMRDRRDELEGRDYRGAGQYLSIRDRLAQLYAEAGEEADAR